jgi:hypothetical protein
MGEKRMATGGFIGAGDTDGLHRGGSGHCGQKIAAEIEEGNVVEAFVAFGRGVGWRRRRRALHRQTR